MPARPPRAWRARVCAPGPQGLRAGAPRRLSGTCRVARRAPGGPPCGSSALRIRQEWMGHRDAKTTLLYADYQPGEQESGIINRAVGAPARPRGIEQQRAKEICPIAFAWA